MNKLKAWFYAARPRTLPASVSPVILGAVLAYKSGSFKIIPAALCFLVALLAQIASNFANDYFDYKSGADGKDRLGPSRAVASGWITPKAMLAGTFITLGAAMACGIGLLYYSSWWLIIVGACIGLCVLAYSSGPFPLAYNGLGDVCVLLFYGIVPVCFTYYVLTGAFSGTAFVLSVALGLLSTNILIVNNYRDYAQDKTNNKRTSVVMFGKKFARTFYLINGALAVVIAISVFDAGWFTGVFIIYFLLFLYTWRTLKMREGRALNPVLGHTARNVLIFTLITCFSLIVKNITSF